jgi:hypothetical protein
VSRLTGMILTYRNAKQKIIDVVMVHRIFRVLIARFVPDAERARLMREAFVRAFCVWN